MMSQTNHQVQWNGNKSMVKIFVVDNGGQWTHREWRTLRDLEVETKIVPNTIAFDDLVAEPIDGLVLSGGAPRVGLTGELGNCGEYLEKATFPILGICAGHHYMARFFGGDATTFSISRFFYENLYQENTAIFYFF